MAPYIVITILFFKILFIITVDIQNCILVLGYRIVLRQSYTLQSGPLILQVPTWHHTVITMLVTVFPMLHFTSPWLYCNYQFVLLNPSTSFTYSFHPFPFWKSPFLSLCLWVCFNFVMVNYFLMKNNFCNLNHNQ